MPQAMDSIRNGIDTDRLYATLDLVKAQPELGVSQFRATNAWLGGTHNRSAIQGFYAAGGEDDTRSEPFYADAGEPPLLMGTNEGPNPAEYLLHALAACLTTAIVNVAAARKVILTRVECHIAGDIDLRGTLGLSDEVRNGFSQIRIGFHVEGDASPEKLREVVERAKARSAVYDMVTHGVPVAVDVATA